MKIPNPQIDSYLQKIAVEKIAGCLLFGPESSVVKYRFDLIAKKICSDLSDPFLVSTLSKERLVEDKAILTDEFFSSPMLGGRKLILIKDGDATAGAAIKLLFEDRDYAKKSENFILLQAGDLDKSSALRKLAEDNPDFVAIACYEDDERTIKKFIADELTKKQVKCSSETIEFLIERFGKNRQIISSELEKIIIFLGNEKLLNIEIAECITASEAEISANEFVMNFAAKKYDQALQQAEKLMREGFEAITLIRFLSNYLQKLYEAKVVIEAGDVDFESAVKSQRLFFKTEIEFRKHLKNFSLNFLIKILQELEKLEIKIKSGIAAPSLTISGFVTAFLVKKAT